MRYRALLCLAAALALPAAADTPPAPWESLNINEPVTPGSAAVDANGVWTIQGTGHSMLTRSDTHFVVAQRVKGDALLRARYLEHLGGRGELRSVGLTLRQDDSPGAPHASLGMSTSNGLLGLLRRQARTEPLVTFAGPSRIAEAGLHLALQRTGSQVATYYSRDGQVWTAAALPPQVVPSLAGDALIGLFASHHTPGRMATARYDRVSLEHGAMLVTGLTSHSGDRSVLLQWRPLPGALGYRVYRGPAGAGRDQMARITSDQVAGTWFADTAGTLLNGTEVTYGVAAIVTGTNGEPIEGPMVAVPATPIAAPPGFTASSFCEGERGGTVLFDAATGEITLRGSGLGDSLNQDQCLLLGRPVEGDFQVRVRTVARPTGPSPEAGLIVRE